MSYANALAEQLQSVFGDCLSSCGSSFDQVTIEVPAEQYHGVMSRLRDKSEFKFSILVDLCGVDYSTHAAYAAPDCINKRFAVVVHLLSIQHNRRLRVRVFCDNSDFPRLLTVSDLWSTADWYEREAFDLFGIMFDGHPDLRRILTDYGFIGHPFRKDFPVSGYVEMCYDPQVGRVVYQPVSIEPRENVPRIIREENYGDV